MAASNVLEHYLVSLSMKGPTSTEVREAEKAFDALAEAVAVVVPTITAAATAIVYATDKIAAGLSKLYYEAQKANVSIRTLDAAGKAMVQSGTTLEKFHADFDKFSEKLRLFPQYKDVLKRQLGLRDEDFKDAATAHQAYLKAMAERRKHGDMQVGMLDLMKTDEDVILARGRAVYDPYFQKQMESNEYLPEAAEKAVALIRSLDALGDSLETLGRKMAAALFDKYGLVLDDMTKWVNEHSEEIVADLVIVVDQLVLAWRDIEPVAVPAMHLIAAGLDRTAAALDRLLGSPDGQHGGLHAVRYVLDALAAYIAGKWALKLAGLLGIRALIRLLPGGAALLAAYEGAEAFAGDPGHALGGSGVAAAERLWDRTPGIGKADGDDSYELDHPGWHPGMPKEETWAQKERLAMPEPGTQDYIKKGGYGPFSHDQNVGAGQDFNIPGAQGAFHPIAGSASDIRGFNLGNIRAKEGGFKKFETPADAAHAIIEQLSRYKTMFANMKGVDTLAGALKKYAPRADRNDPAEYARQVEQWTGLPRHAKLDLNNPEVAAKVAYGITRKEGHLQGRTLNDFLDIFVRHGAPLRHSFGHPHQVRKQWVNNIGSRKQVTNIQLASTDPHTAASEIARHMKAIHAGTLRSLDRLA
jgi:hypothetical protein